MQGVSPEQAEERAARKQAALEFENGQRYTLVEQNGWWGVHDSAYMKVELLSRERYIAKRALAARRAGVDDGCD